MRYKLLGKSGLRVSELCLGTMTFGTEWGWGAEEADSRKMFDTFLNAGGNFIDTANRYTEGTSEKLVGKFIRDAGVRDKTVLATKYTLFMEQGDPNSAGNHRKNMVQAVEHSLKRLGTDYIDLYWLHAWDFMTPVEEVMRGLDDLVRSGKVVYVGVSDTPAWVVSRSNMLAELRGWSPFVALQIEYSLIERTVERELIPMARELDLAVTPWGAIGGGILTGKYSGQTDQPKRYDPKDQPSRLTKENIAIGDEVVKIAKEMGCAPSEVAINWVRQQPGLQIPIIGARNADQLAENLACLEHPLSQEHLDRLDQVSRIDLGFPMEFITKDFIRNLIFAGTFDKIDNHRAKY
ncbi:aldo/keto reductase [candidate division GN15 bacterium]|nr:aldo/keto reductase [candidate division GN15 bacterium]